MGPGACAGFPAGGIAHHLVNRSDADVVYLEMGDRVPGDSADYPQDDLKIAADDVIPPSLVDAKSSVVVRTVIPTRNSHAAHMFQEGWIPGSLW